jgi:hypothetical protein
MQIIMHIRIMKLNEECQMKAGKYDASSRVHGLQCCNLTTAILPVVKSYDTVQFNVWVPMFPGTTSPS